MKYRNKFKNKHYNRLFIGEFYHWTISQLLTKEDEPKQQFSSL